MVGTRPQIIKSVPVIHAAHRLGLDIQVIHTGQHYDPELSAAFFDNFDIPEPSVNLEVGSGSQGFQTGEIMIRLERVLEQIRPELVVVPGDTNSALASAISTIKMGVPVAHLEAGARCYDMKMQEEINRRIVDQISTLLFSVSRRCLKNLAKENAPGRARYSGDTMFQVFVESLFKVGKSRIIDRLNLTSGEYFVLTLHRAENTVDATKLLSVVSDLASFGRKIVFPIHPRTKNLLRGFTSKAAKENLLLISPLDYYDMIRLVRDSILVVTDSGGLQKEAFWSGIPCVTVRGKTEWTETIDCGANFLATGPDSVHRIVSRVLRRYEFIKDKIARAENPYGFGTKKPGEAIVRDILEYTSRK